MSVNQAGGQREERWTRTDSWAFWSFGLGMLLEAYIFGMASIATGWVAMPPVLRSLLLAWAPLWLIIGIAIAGPMSDRVGRKKTFYTTMALYGVGAIGIVFSHTYVMILVFLAILLFAAGGEMNTIMAASHEMMPTKHRSKTMFLELNFINLGGFLLAAVDLFSISSSVTFQRGMIAATFLVVLFILFMARNRMPESIRWLHKQGNTERARSEIARFYGVEEYATRQAVVEHEVISEKRVGVPLRLFATITTAFAGSAGFGLMTYVLGPHYFASLTATIILVATATGFFSGFFGFWADRFSRKNLLLIGYGGTFIMTVIIFFTISVWSKNMSLFWTLLILLNVFVNIGYLTEDTLKSEVWPTKTRGTYTAIVRFVSIGMYILTIYLTQNYTLNQTMLFSVVVWAIGLAGAIAWYIGGVETGRGVSLEAASGESNRN